MGTGVTTPTKLELPWRDDISSWFECIRDLPCPVWLDSGGGSGTRYDILAAAPVSLHRVAPGEGGGIAPALRQMLGQAVAVPAGLPFCGGAIGCLGYEVGREWKGMQPAHALARPIAVFGQYDWAIVADHLQRRVWLVSGGRGDLPDAQWAALRARLEMEPVDTAPRPLPGQLRGNSLEWAAYRRAFERVQHYLREGDIYQVNLTRRFEACSTEDAYSLYRRLREISPAPYGAFLDFGDFQLLSNSPEQFLSLDAGGRVTTRPIKGTRPRAADPARDAQLRADLLASEKDRAENLMIVDLLRNDLGQVCREGSIEVPELFAVASFAKVHHLVSTVTGQLAKGRDAIDLLRACFPGGSITGAPKQRAMQIIDELEPVSRELYCGSVFYLGYDGRMDSSITIRTVLKHDSQLYYWAGGGIVADSEAKAEYRESEDKAAAFLQLL